MVPVTKELVVEFSLYPGLMVKQVAVILFERRRLARPKTWFPANLLPISFFLSRRPVGFSVGVLGAGSAPAVEGGGSL